MGNCRKSVKNLTVLAALVAAAGLTTACGGGGGAGKGAASADDADGGSGESGGGEEGAAKANTTVSEDNTFCIDSTIGQRYLVEEALEEAGLETVDSCLTADVMVREAGESGAFELRYQKVGAGEWNSCESALENQRDFLASCVREMVGGAAPVASAE